MAASLINIQLFRTNEWRQLFVVSARLEDGELDVRRVAVETLAAITDKGDKEAIAAVSSRLEHGNPYVRGVAVEALAAITDKGDKEAIAAVSARLEDGDQYVRRVAVEALAAIMYVGVAAKKRIGCWIAAK